MKGWKTCRAAENPARDKVTPRVRRIFSAESARRAAGLPGPPAKGIELNCKAVIWIIVSPLCIYLCSFALLIFVFIAQDESEV